MVFSSIPFLFFFLPLCLVLYHGTALICLVGKGRGQRLVIPLKNGILLAFSLVFYAWGEPVYILLMLFASAVDYTNGRLMTRFGSTQGKKWFFLCCSVLINLSVLAFFNTRTL